MQSAAGNPRKLLGLCYEALRFRPHNPLVQRQAGPAAVVAGKSVAPGAMVWAMTLSAMHDESAFPRSGIILDDRPLDRYFHFGGGLHRCAGLDANARQIPNLVGALVALRPRLVSDLRFDGPFPDELVVALQGR